MSEVIVSVIPAGGGDYSLLSTFESGEQRTLSTDEVAVAECQAGDIDDEVAIVGWDTTASGSGIVIRPASGHEHGGLKTGGFRVVKSVNNGLIRCGGHKITVKGIVLINASTTGNNGAGISTATAANALTVDSCIIIGAGASGRIRGVLVTVASDVVKVFNTVVAKMGGSSPTGLGVQSSNASATVHAYNNTAVDCRFCYVHSSGTFRAKNNIAQNPGTGAGYSGTFTDSATNISSDATSPQTGLRNISLTFADAANDDYHLDAGDTEAIGAGTDLHADATIPFNWDFDNDTRPNGSWDIGADQTADAANEMSGTPSAQATDASGTMDAVASGSGTPQAGAATSEGSLQHVAVASGSPQAGAATVTGSFGGTVSASGSPQAGAAVAAGEAQAVASATGAAQAGSPTSAGALMVVVSMSGAPQAGLTDGFGTADDGQAPLITAKRKGMIVDVGEVLRP